MRTKYGVLRVRTRGECDEIPEAYTMLSIQVHEHDVDPEPTGVLDADGNEYYRWEERDPIGFMRFT